MSCSRSLYTGRLCRCSMMEPFCFCPNCGALPKACFFHSGIWCADRPVPRSSDARCLSPSAAMGSSQGRERSLGTASISACCSSCIISRRSLASAPAAIAARCMLPSGLATMRMGLTSSVFDVWPARNAGSASLSSISTSRSSSVVSSMRPFVGSYVGNSSTGSTPDAMSCCASQRSGELIFLPRWRADDASRSAASICERVRPLSPRVPCRPRPATEVSLPRFAAGSRSSPVSWLTSRMDSEILPLDTEITFTQQSCPLRTTSDALVTRAALIMLTCTMPSGFPRTPSMRTKQPKSITLDTVPRYTAHLIGSSSIGPCAPPP
mmetsp:Transcript_10769/g.44554  ORF Transcript_10769/g.44554 Transcript_10769/m.44554 type:complete len:323 (-) Transcript_10769:2361-3329(-)